MEHSSILGILEDFKEFSEEERETVNEMMIGKSVFTDRGGLFGMINGVELKDGLYTVDIQVFEDAQLPLNDEQK